MLVVMTQQMCIVDRIVFNNTMLVVMTQCIMMKPSSLTPFTTYHSLPERNRQVNKGEWSQGTKSRNLPNRIGKDRKTLKLLNSYFSFKGD